MIKFVKSIVNSALVHWRARVVGKKTQFTDNKSDIVLTCETAKINGTTLELSLNGSHSLEADWHDIAKVCHTRQQFNFALLYTKFQCFRLKNSSWMTEENLNKIVFGIQYIQMFKHCHFMKTLQFKTVQHKTTEKR